jgi:predicted tellurium resistance membrane protein TerC
VPRAHAPAFFGIYYAGFGVVGVAASMMGLGIVSAWIYKFWKNDPTVALTQVLLALWVGFLWELYHRGRMTWLLVNFSYYLRSVFLIAIFARLTINSGKKRGKSECLV